MSEAEQQDWASMMHAAQAGDAETYMRLLHQIAPFIRVLLRPRTPPHQIEDVLQDVLLTLHRIRHTYDPARPFVPFLAAIAQRRAIDAHRRRARVAAHESIDDTLDTLAEPARDHPGDRIDAERRAAWLRQAIQALPRRQRTAVQLVKLDELSIAEAAARTGQSPGAVKVNVHRGLHALRRLLGDDPA